MHLLRITRTDLDFARILRNQSRKWFVDAREIASEQQIEWFRRIESDPSVDFRIICVGQSRIGTVSITDHGSRCEIGNVIIDKAEQCKGYAAAALKILLAPDVSYFARILPDNIASQMLFHSLGFRQSSETEWELLPLAKEC